MKLRFAVKRVDVPKLSGRIPDKSEKSCRQMAQATGSFCARKMTLFQSCKKQSIPLPCNGRDERKKLKIWWTWSGSNRRPLPCHGSALPAAPQAHSSEKQTKQLLFSTAAGASGN